MTPTSSRTTLDPAKAKELLAAAGYPNGFSTKFGLSLSDLPSPIYKQVFEAMAAELQTNAGVQLEIESFPPGQTVANVL